jgi:hypothetical protein
LDTKTFLKIEKNFVSATNLTPFLTVWALFVPVELPFFAVGSTLGCLMLPLASASGGRLCRYANGF